MGLHWCGGAARNIAAQAVAIPSFDLAACLHLSCLLRSLPLPPRPLHTRIRSMYTLFNSPQSKVRSQGSSRGGY